jgi:hypothetical protein
MLWLDAVLVFLTKQCLGTTQFTERGGMLLMSGAIKIA